MALSPLVLGPLRAALATQGLQDAIDANGDVNFGALASQAYDTIEFRSQLTPTVSVATAGTPGAAPSWVAGILKPMVTFKGKAGTVVVAPEGVPGNYGWAAAAGIVFGLVGLGYALGRMKR